MKTCSKCHVEQPLSEFYKDSTKSSGYQPACKSCKRLYDRTRHARNPGPARERSIAQRINRRPSLNGYKAAYRRRNNSYYSAQARKRYERIKQAAPTWLTPAQQADIAQFYDLSKELSAISGIPYCVDHIIPIQGKNVCGLHVPWNLQILTVSENSLKHNKAPA